MTIAGVTISVAACPTLRFVAWHNVVPDPVTPARYLWTLGGQRYDGPLVASDCYKIDLTTNAVVDRFQLPWWYGHSPAVVMDSGKVVIPGGMGVKGPIFTGLDVAQLIDLTAKTSTYYPLTSGGYDFEAVRCGSGLIYLGGHAWDGSESWSRWEAGYISESNGALLNDPFPAGMVASRVYPRAVTLDNGNVLAIGGLEYSTNRGSHLRNLALLEELTAAGASTVWPATLANARRYHSCRKFGSKIVVAGGTLSATWGRPPATNLVEQIDTVAKTVSALPNLASPRYHAQSAIVAYQGNYYLLLVGGQSDNLVPVLNAELYDLAAGTSQILGAIPACVDHDRIAAIVGTSLVVVGGADPGRSPERGMNNIITIGFPAGAVLTRV